MLVKDLRVLAKAHGVKGFSKMKKRELEKNLEQQGAIKGCFKLFMYNHTEQEEQIYNDHLRQEVMQDMIKIKNTTGQRFKVFKMFDKEDRLLAHMEN
jgi:hypothetical protein